MLLEPVGAVSARFLPWLAAMQVRGLVLLAAAGIALWLLRRSSAALRHLVLLLAVIGLLTLPLLSLFLPSRYLPSLPQPVISSRRTLPEIASVAVKPSQDGTVKAAVPVEASPALQSESSQMLAAAVTEEIEVKYSSSPRAFSVVGVSVLLLWGLGAASLLLRLGTELCRLHRLAKRARPATALEPLLTDALSGLALSSGRRQVRLLVGTDDLPGLSPMTWGWLRPVVLLPAESVTWTPACLRSVLLHEVAHVQRGDWATELLARVVCALYWPNPLVWLIARHLHSESERACDDAVLCAGVVPTEYARHMVDVAHLLCKQRMLSAPATLLMAHKPEIEGRVRAILSEKQSRKPTNGRVVTVALVVLVGLLLPLASLRGALAGEQTEGASPNPAQEDAAGGSHPRPVTMPTRDVYTKLISTAGGMRVELLPVLGKLADGSLAWCCPDGSHVTGFTAWPPYGESPTIKGQRIVGVRVHFPTDALARHASIKLEFDNAPVNRSVLGATLGEYRDGIGGNNAPVVLLGRHFPAKQKKVTLRLGIATGDRKTIIAGPPTRTTIRRLPTGEVITLSPAYRAPLGTLRGPGREVTIVKVTAPIGLVGKRSDFWLYPIGWDGKIFKVVNGGWNIPDENKSVATLQCRFRTSELPLAKIKEFRFVARPFRTLIVPDIVLQPEQTTAKNALTSGLVKSGATTLYNVAIASAQHLAKLPNGVEAQELQVSGLQPDSSFAVWDRDGNQIMRYLDGKIWGQKAGELRFEIQHLTLPGGANWLDKATVKHLMDTQTFATEFGVVGGPAGDLGMPARQNYGSDYYTLSTSCTGKAITAAKVDLYLTVLYGPWQTLGECRPEQGAQTRLPGGGTVRLLPLVVKRHGEEIELVADIPSRFVAKDADGRPFWRLRLEQVDANGNGVGRPRVVQFVEATAGSPVARVRFRFVRSDLPYAKMASVRLLAHPLETLYFRDVPTRPTKVSAENL